MSGAPLRLIVMGSPAFGIAAFEKLRAEHTIIAAYCQAPEPAGRGMQLRKCAVHEWAETHSIPVYTPRSFKKEPAAIQLLKSLNADAAIVAAYGLILPQAVLDAPRFGCINIHASLLPRWRGAAPIQRAIQAGDTQSGVCIMQMEAGLDTGGVWAEATTPITPATTAATLHDALAQLGGGLILPALEKIVAGTPPTPQPAEGVTYAHKIDKSEAELDFTRTAAELDCHIRAFTPWPGAWFISNGQRIKVHGAVAEGTSTAAPRTLLDTNGIIACGNGTALRFLTLQREGKKPQPAAEFFRGFGVKLGDVL